jgi:hypothetical protein
MATVTQAQGSTNKGSATFHLGLTGSTWRDRIAHATRQVRAAVEEMNYAARRTVELQTRLSK